MKKVLVALTAVVALAGCNNTKPLVTDIKPTPHAHGHAHVHKDAHPHTYATMNDKKVVVDVLDKPIKYTCENNASLVATYHSDIETVDTVLNVPSLSLQNANVVLKQTAAGSGSRYENKTNPATGYEWHTKAHEGILSITVAGSEYNFLCEVEKAKKHAM